jgi:hypothetical protein
MRRAQSDPAEARQRVRRAQVELRRALRALAKASQVDPGRLERGPRDWVHDLVQAHGPKLARRRGAVGWSRGIRLRGGEPALEECLALFVRKKRPKRELGALEFPKSVRHARKRKKLGLDVVELSDFRRLAYPGLARVTPHGLDAPGTLGCFATDASTRRKVALTAMHVTGLEAYPAPGTAPLQLDLIDDTRRILGELLEGTQDGIDAAKIDVEQPGEVVYFIPGIGGLTGWRIALDPEDRDTAVRMRGAQSLFHRGSVVYPRACLPTIGFERAIVADILSDHGDSGAALVDSDANLLGLLSGDALFDHQRLAIFTPIDLILSRLSCAFP